jgi:hypothetical protein
MAILKRIPKKRAPKKTTPTPPAKAPVVVEGDHPEPDNVEALVTATADATAPIVDEEDQEWL